MPPITYLLQRIKVYKGWWELVGFVAVIFAAVVGFNAYVDSRINQKLSDEAFLRKIGMSARPFCIFDNKGSIHFDSGAMQFVGYQNGKSAFDFSALTKEGFPQCINVHFNRLFAYPPTLTVIGAGLTTTAAKRGPGYDWIYTIYSADALVAESSTISPPSDEQDYKLEILF
jgi:hypothetical protein